MGADAKELDQYLNLEKNITYYTGYFRNLRDQKGTELSDRIDRKMPSKAIKAQKDATKKTQHHHAQSDHFGRPRRDHFGRRGALT